MRFWMHYIDIVKYQKVPRAYYRDDINVQSQKQVPVPAAADSPRAAAADGTDATAGARGRRLVSTLRRCTGVG